MKSTAGSLQSLCWASVAVGGIISAYCSGYVVDNYGARSVFAVVGLFPLLVSFSALFVSETPTVVKEGKGFAKCALLFDLISYFTIDASENELFPSLEHKEFSPKCLRLILCHQ